MIAENLVKYLREVDKSNKIKIPKFVRQKCEEDFLELKIQTEDQEKCLIASINKKITIRKQIREQLEIRAGDVVAVEFNKVERADRTNELFKNDEVDLLSLIPEQTSKGYEIIVSEFEKESENFLRIWSPAGTKGARQIEIKRFVDKRALGEMLGQYQAEGQKSRCISRATFTNKEVKEHRDFIRILEALGINDEEITIQCAYNEERISKEDVLPDCQRFENITGYPVDDVNAYGSRGYFVFRTRVRSVLFTEIVLHAMDCVRNALSTKINSQNRVLGEGYLAKLLTGDGTLDTTISPAREYGSPSINVKIVDKDHSSLEDYKDVLSNFGFKPHIHEDNMYVRSSCSLSNLLFLYSIEAFENTRNRDKLAITVMLLLKGRRYSTYERFVDLIDVEEIHSGVVSERYEVSKRAASEWLNNKVEEGLLSVRRESPYPKLYDLTDEARVFAESLFEIEGFANNIKEEKEVKSYEKALEALKSDIRF